MRTSILADDFNRVNKTCEFCFRRELWRTVEAFNAIPTRGKEYPMGRNFVLAIPITSLSNANLPRKPANFVE